MCRLSLVAVSGATLHWGAQASCWGWLLLWGTGSVVVVHGLRCSVACGIFLEQGSNLCPQHCLAGSYSLYHQESPFISKFKKLKNIIFFSVELLLPNIWQLWIVQWSYHHSGPVFQIRGCMERPIIWWTSALRYISFTLNEFLGQKQCCVEYYDAKEGIFFMFVNGGFGRSILQKQGKLICSINLIPVRIKCCPFHDWTHLI